MSQDLVRIDHRHHFVGDTHFGHVGILDMAMRPYADIKATTVTKSIIGMLSSAMATTSGTWATSPARTSRLIVSPRSSPRLNGTTHLIRGNHDGDEVCEKLPWASVDVMRTLVGSDGRKVVLCHYPLLEWEGYHAGDRHFHGHTHDRRPSNRRRWDVGVDHQAFRPMTYEAIVERMSALPDVE